MLLAIYLFNLAGYNFVFSLLIHQSNNELVRHLDHEQYSEAELVELKIALHLPYYNSTAGYERVDGEVNVGGKDFNFVKRKVSKDTLYILCIPNTSKDKLKHGQSEYASLVNDLPSQKHHNSGKIGSLLTEYEPDHMVYDLATVTRALPSCTHRFSSRLTTIYPDNNFPPPDVLA